MRTFLVGPTSHPSSERRSWPPWTTNCLYHRWCARGVASLTHPHLQAGGVSGIITTHRYRQALSPPFPARRSEHCWGLDIVTSKTSKPASELLTRSLPQHALVSLAEIGEYLAGVSAGNEDSTRALQAYRDPLRSIIPNTIGEKPCQRVATRKLPGELGAVS